MTAFDWVWVIAAQLIVLIGAWAIFRPRKQRSTAEIAREVAAARVDKKKKAVDRVIKEARANIRCGSCIHFDRDEGQAILGLYPAFPRHDLPPCMIGAQYDEQTGGIKINEAVPAKCSWDDFGACGKHGELRWSEDKCDDYEAGPRS